MITNIDKLHNWKLRDGSTIGLQKFAIQEAMSHFASFDAPILHIGSKASILDTDGGKWRKHFVGKEFIGVDLEMGDNVDHVFDITKNISTLRKKTGIKQFSTIICPHVLEHVKNPFEVASNIEKLLKKGGRAIISVPWVQGFHEFPNDYWRISFEGLKQLFQNCDFELEYYSDAKEETAYQLTYDDMVEHSVRTCRIERNIFQFLMDDMPSQPMFSDHEGEKIHLSSMYMPAMSVNVVVVKR